MAANETEAVDVAREFNLLPVIFETIQALQKTNDAQEFTKKVLLHFSIITFEEKVSKPLRTFLNTVRMRSLLTVKGLEHLCFI